MNSLSPVAVSLDGQVTIGDFHLEVALTMAPGELVALVGPNGAGKSTLLHVVAGLIGLDTGTLSLGGRTVDDGTVRGRTPPHERRVGWVPQNRLLFDHMTVADNVGFSPRATPNKVSYLLDALDLRHLADRHPMECSGGQAQRVAVARALAASPEILLLDEPSTALDAKSQEMIHDLLGDRKRRPSTLLVSHDTNEVAGLADRTIELTSGRITKISTR